MPKIIFTSRYIKNPASLNAGKLIKYMGTREGVEKLPYGIDSSPATKKQNDLICTALKTVPEAWDYSEMKSYLENKTKANATEFLDEFFERNADRIDGVKKLVNYYAERPGVEKIGKHGLFSQTDDKINLDDVADEVSSHNGIVWTHVISLKREDAERLGYNNANAWKSLVRRNALEIAKAHKIEPSDLQWYGAFHNTTHHSHIHLMVFSKSGQGYLTNNGIESMRSSFGNYIFRNEQYKLFEMQTEIRDVLKNEAKNLIETKGLHSLRHTFATNLVNGIKQEDGSIKSLTPRQVADLLGHTTSEITEMYYVKRDLTKLNGITDEFNL